MSRMAERTTTLIDRLADRLRKQGKRLQIVCIYCGKGLGHGLNCPIPLDGEKNA